MFEQIIEKVKALNPLFLLAVVAPTTIAILYFGFIASDVYVSESKFIVHSAEKQAILPGGIGSLLKIGGGGGGSDEEDSVIDYARSRDALTALNQGGRVESSFASPKIDIFDRFGGLGFHRSFEALYRYYGHKVLVEEDTSSDTATLTVRAYTAQDAHDINERLLTLSEALVNRLNDRAQRDLIFYAQRDVDEAEAHDREAALALSAFRNAKGLVDPEKQAEVNLQLISKIQDDLISTKTELLELRQFTPQNPQVAVLTDRAAGLQKEIDLETAKVAGGNESLAGDAARYERLDLERQFAERQLTTALASLEAARDDARRKQVYLERIVEPNLADKSTEPARLRNILVTFVLGLVAWGVLSMLLAGLREHQD